MKIVFENVSKSYGVVDALKELSFQVAPGEFYFIVGPSGAGKSTILKLLLGQIKPTSGTIIVGEQDISTLKRSHIDSLRRRIGVVFQDFQLINDKNIEENIALALDIIGYPSENIPARIDEVIKQVNLQSRRFLFPAQLSGGELQRVSLARALAVEPELILADEPTGNLDPQNAWNLVKLLKDISEKSNTTIIMTTHNYEIVNALSKNVLKLDSGRDVSSTKSTPEATESSETVTPKVKTKTKKVAPLEKDRKIDQSNQETSPQNKRLKVKIKK